MSTKITGQNLPDALRGLVAQHDPAEVTLTMSSADALELASLLELAARLRDPAAPSKFCALSLTGRL